MTFAIQSCMLQMSTGRIGLNGLPSAKSQIMGIA